jgi:DNA polymerase III epsilon subunit-like protein
MRVVCFDTETTALFHPRIISLGWAECNEGPTGELLVLPEQGVRFDPGAIAIHGYTRERLQTLGAGTLVEALEKFNAFLSEPPDHVVLVAHNWTRFDGPVLRSELQRAGMRLPDNVIGAFDTLTWSRANNKKTRAHTLDALMGYWGVRGIDRTVHGACIDSVALRAVFEKMLPEGLTHLAIKSVSFQSAANWMPVVAAPAKEAAAPAAAPAAAAPATEAETASPAAAPTP